MKRERWRKDDFFFQKNVSGHSNPPDELAQRVSKKKKIPVGRFFPPFFCRKCRIWPFLNYLHDSNTIFWAQGIKSEGFFVRTVLDEKAPDGYTWSGGRLTRKQLTSRLDHQCPELWKSMGKHAKLKEKQKWSEEKIHLDNARKLRGIYFIDPPRIRNSRKPSRTRVRSWKHQLLLLCPVKL